MKNSNNLHRRMVHNHHAQRRDALPNPEPQFNVESSARAVTTKFIFVTAPAPTTNKPQVTSHHSGSDHVPGVASFVASFPTPTPTPTPTPSASSINIPTVLPAVSPPPLVNSKTPSSSSFLKTVRPTSTSAPISRGTHASSSSRVLSNSISLSSSISAHNSLPTLLNSPSTTSIISASTASSPSPSAASSSSNDMSAGVYAGIIGGSVGVVLLVLGLFALLYRRRQTRAAEKYGNLEDEKDLRQLANSPDNGRFSPPPFSPIVPTAPMAPRLTLGPMTNFMPGLEEPTQSEKQTPAPMNRGPVRQPPPALIITNEKENTSGPFATPQASPAVTESTMGVSSPGGNPSPVHRVMIDFKPSMGDELELKTGDLVKMLHEYDDGWALCIRMDRSQQGVCPRTCLSQRPVKPRNPPGVRGPRMGDSSPIGGYPNAEQGNIQGQHASRPLSPASGRPLTPTGLTARSQANRGPPSNSRPPPAGQRPGSPSSGQMQNTSRGPRPESPATRSGRPPHPLSKMQKEDDIEFHAM